jgi:hypothetical protein
MLLGGLVRCLAKGLNGVEAEKTKRDKINMGRRRKRRTRRPEKELKERKIE